MTRRLLVLLGVLALGQAATAEAQATKWHPGHYVLLNFGGTLEDHTMEIDQLRTEPNFRGVMLRFRWRTLEPVRDQYDFSEIDTYLAMLRTTNPPKRLVVRIMDRNFDHDDPTGNVPDYLLQDPAFDGGVFRNRIGYVARLWEAPVMDRLIALYQALGRRYDAEPLIEGVFTEETTMSFDPPDPPGFTDQLLAQQWARFGTAVKPSWPTTNFFLNASWLRFPENMAALIQSMHDARVALGGSNIFPGSPTTGQKVLIGQYGADYRLELAIGFGVEIKELRQFTPQEIGTYANDTLHANYLFWTRNTTFATPESQWWTAIVPYVRHGGPLQTDCPHVYGTCDTSDPPVQAPQNQPPIVSAGSDASVPLPNATVTLAGSATDDGLPGPLALSWAQVSGPTVPTFTDPTSPSSQASFAAAGTYVLRLTASDGELSATDDVTVIVTAAAGPTNQPPHVNAGSDQSVQLPSSATLTGAATDDGLPGPSLTFQWSQVSGPAQADLEAADAASTAASFPSAGTYVLRLAANDGQLSASDDVTVIVTPAPEPAAPPPASSPPRTTPPPASTPPSTTPPPSSSPPSAATPMPTSGGGGALGLLDLLWLGLASGLSALPRSRLRRSSRRSCRR